MTKGPSTASHFFAGLFLLLLAIFLQLFLSSTGIALSLVLAVLIAFAFIFDFLELLLFDLIAIFLFNWQPAPSASLIAFAFIPLAAFGFRHAIRTESWVGVLAVTILGLFLFYMVSVSGHLSGHVQMFLLDLLATSAAAELTFFVMG